MPTIARSLLAGALALSACTERVELDLGDLAEPKIVVEGWITDQPGKHRVRITRTRSYFDNVPAPAVSGAVVIINDGTQTVLLAEAPQGSGNYYTPDGTAGVVGRTCTLSIEAEGRTYTASDPMRPVPPLDSLSVTYFEPGPLDQPPLYEVRIWTHELPGLGDHYRWRNSINGVLDDSLKRAFFVDDLLYDGAYVENVNIGRIRAWPGDTVRTEQMSISLEAFDVITAILTETDYRGGLFDPPPTNVPSNISNGALGFFGASSVKDRTVIVP